MSRFVLKKLIIIIITEGGAWMWSEHGGEAAVRSRSPVQSGLLKGRAAQKGWSG